MKFQDTQFIVIIYVAVMCFTLFANGEFLMAQTATVALPTEIQGDPLTTIDIPITITTSSEIGLAQFVVEFSSNALSFKSAQIGSDAAGFMIFANPNLPFPPSTPGTDDNVLVQISSGGFASITGNSQQVAILSFEVNDLSGDSSPLAFDQGTNKSFLTTLDLKEINGSDITFIDSNFLVVPVELIAFAGFVKDNHVELQWSTATEADNYGFEIERSSDQSNFSTIGFVTGKGTTTIPQKYCYLDENLATGTYYYRLKQIDFNGTFKYSVTIQEEILMPQKILLLQNYPNPFNPETTIEYYLSSDCSAILRIYNLAGQEVRLLGSAQKNAGFHREVWDGKNNSGEEVSSGSYMYTIEGDEFRLTGKMVKTR